MSYIDPDPDLDAYRRHLAEDPDAVEVDGGFEIRQKHMTSFFPDPGTVPCVNRHGRRGHVWSIHYLHFPETEQDSKS
jgi:hypothetical protein